ncbi:hypothetical protein [Kocuria flava]
MDGTTLQEAAALTAAAMPGVSLTHPFGPEHDVYKVAGRIFLNDHRGDR